MHTCLQRLCVHIYTGERREINCTLHLFFPEVFEENQNIMLGTLLKRKVSFASAVCQFSVVLSFGFTMLANTFVVCIFF